jgi:hypothetical protein
VDSITTSGPLPRQGKVSAPVLSTFAVPDPAKPTAHHYSKGDVINNFLANFDEGYQGPLDIPDHHDPETRVPNFLEKDECSKRVFKPQETPKASSSTKDQTARLGIARTHSIGWPVRL